MIINFVRLKYKALENAKLSWKVAIGWQYAGSRKID